MGLSDDLLSLKDRTLLDLTTTHDYYTHTQVAWQVARDMITVGSKYTIRNKVTGSLTTETQLLGKIRGYVTEQLTAATFQQLISTFENFFLDLLRLWLTVHPGSLGTKTIEFKTVLEAPDKEAITAQVVDHELYQLLYKRPAEWFVYLNGRVKLNCPTKAEIDQFAEAKATRDVLVHNRGVVNKTYLSKAGGLAQFADGERVEITQRYHRATWVLLQKLVRDISDAAVAKAA